MFLPIHAYLGEVLTIARPCILPVLLFVFARVERPIARDGLPMLADAVLAGVAAIVLGLDTHLLTRVSLACIGGIEQKLITAIHLVGPVRAAARATGALPVEGELASLAGATQWFNSRARAARHISLQSPASV